MVNETSVENVPRGLLTIHDTITRLLILSSLTRTETGCSYTHYIHSNTCLPYTRLWGDPCRPLPLRVRDRPVRRHLAHVILRRLARAPPPSGVPRARLDPPGDLQQDLPRRGLTPHPRVPQRLLGRVPFAAVDAQELAQQVLRAVGQVVGPPGEAQLKAGVQVGSGGDGVAVVVEGDAAAEEDEDDDAEGPGVHGFRVVSAL